MHFDRNLYTVILRKLSVLLPVGRHLLLPLPFEHVKIFGRPRASYPVGILGCIAITGAAGEIDDHGNPELGGQFYGVFAGVAVALAGSGDRVQRIAMAAEGTDRKAVVLQLLLKLFQFTLALEHRQLAVRIAGVVTGAQFNRVDVERLELLDDFIKGELRKQGSETSNSHVVKTPSSGKYHEFAPARISQGFVATRRRSPSIGAQVAWSLHGTSHEKQNH
jgi:hypothetical protein